MFDDLLSAFEDLGEETTDDLLEELPGVAELKALCSNRAFQIICHVCQHLQQGESAKAAVGLAQMQMGFTEHEE